MRLCLSCEDAAGMQVVPPWVMSWQGGRQAGRQAGSHAGQLNWLRWLEGKP